MSALTPSRRVLVTGSEGYIGRLLCSALSADPGPVEHIVAADVRPPAAPLKGAEHVIADVRDEALGQVMAEHRVDTVVHLAAVVSPGPDAEREFLHSVEVRGTRNVLRRCLEAGVERFIYTSSGAAYGYHADNAEWLKEDDPIRGNAEFAYSDHKRQVEEMLARWREKHPELRQLIFRPGTILGETANNQITALFDKPVVLGIAGAAIPFVLIWDQDVVGALMQGIHRGGEGIYNLAGDGALPLKEMAAMLGKRYLPLPAAGLAGALWLLKQLRLTRYGPEQVGFLRYRPVLDNTALKSVFGYIPRKTTREVFEFYLRGKGITPAASASPPQPPQPKPPAPKEPAPNQAAAPAEPSSEAAGERPGAVPPPPPRPVPELEAKAPIEASPQTKPRDDGVASDKDSEAEQGDPIRASLRRDSKRFRRRFGKEPR